MANVQLVFGECYCYCREFTINDVEADYDDFVDKYDHDIENAPDYGCGNMTCDIKKPIDIVLKKYGINEDEYRDIAEKLVDGLSFGRCAWCS